MTFFGHEGTKTGSSLFAFLFFIINCLIVPKSLAAGASASSASWADSAATYAQTPPSTTFSSPPGANVPPTVGHVAVPHANVTMGTSLVSVNEVESTYRIRSDLSMELTRHYDFTVTPLLQNGVGAALTEGWYLLRLVVVLPNEKYFAREKLGLNIRMTDEERYVTSRKVLGFYSRQTNTFQMQDVKLTFPDMTRGWIRSVLYIKITPIDQSSVAVINNRVDPFNTSIVREIKTDIYPVVSKARFIPLLPDNESRAIDTNVHSQDTIAADLDAYVNRAEKARANLEEPVNIDENAFARPDKANLKILEPWSPELYDSLNWYRMQLPPVDLTMNQGALKDLLRVSKSYLQAMPDKMDATVARALCSEIARIQDLPFLQLKTWIMQCSFYPYYYLNLHKNIHVRNIDVYRTSAQPDDIGNYQIIANFSFNKSKSTDMFYYASANPANLFPLSTAGESLKLLPVGISGSIGQSQSESTVSSGISQGYRTMKIKEFRADIPILRYRTCISAEIDESSFKLPIKVRGIYICDNEMQNLDFSEFYYFGFQDNMGENDVSTQMVNVLLRGQREQNTFFRLTSHFVQPVAKGASNSEKSPMSVGAVFKNSEYIYSRMHPPLPGVISLPMVPKSDIISNENPGDPNEKGFFKTVKGMLGY